MRLSVSPSEETDAQIQVTRVGLVPKVASNFVTKNDRFGAIAAVSETQDDFRFTPIADADCAGTRGGFRHTADAQTITASSR
jgi:hypothetical protein